QDHRASRGGEQTHSRFEWGLGGASHQGEVRGQQRDPGGDRSKAMRIDRAATFRRAFLAGLVMLAAASSIARAELVVLTNGRVVKALSHELTGDRIEIRLPDGNSYTVDLQLVERILDDEVAASDVKT